MFRISHVQGALALLALVLISTTSGADAAAPKAPAVFPDFAAYFAAHKEMSGVGIALNRTGLMATLASANTSVTVFLPTNTAIKKAKISVAKTSPSVLTSLLAYHVYAKPVSSASIKLGSTNWTMLSTGLVVVVRGRRSITLMDQSLKQVALRVKEVHVGKSIVYAIGAVLNPVAPKLPMSPPPFKMDAIPPIAQLPPSSPPLNVPPFAVPPFDIPPFGSIPPPPPFNIPPFESIPPFFNGSPPPPPPMIANDGTDLLSVLTADGDFTFLVASLSMLNMNSIYAASDITLFAPSNAAFEQILEIAKGVGIEVDLTSPTQDPTVLAVLSGMVALHVVPGQTYKASDLEDMMELQTQGDSTLTVNLSAMPGSVVLEVTNMPSSSAVVTKPNMMVANNVIVHKINRVLSSIPLPGGK